VPDILVTLPAYNEEDTVGQVVSDIHRELAGEDYSVLVVSDGSEDNTEKVAAEAGATVARKPHGGLGDTFREEMKIACMVQPNIVVQIDADGQFLACDIMRLVAEVRAGYDLVLGSRLHGNGNEMRRSRVLFNLVGAWGMRNWLQADIADATTGFRAFTLDVARLPIENAYSYTTEQVIRASKAGFKIKSVPVTVKFRQHGESRHARSAAKYIWQFIIGSRKVLR
jgi:glycosyltransferase involved in cell wall biosynthesis